jgi:hypothetical protein
MFSRAPVAVLLSALIACGGTADTSQVDQEVVTTCIDVPAVADAVIANPPKHVNLGDAHVLRVGGRTETLLRFDLALPERAVIDRAVLKLFSVPGVPEARTIGIHRANAAWSESTVTFANFAQHFDATRVSSLDFESHEHGQKSADVTALATSWLTGQLPNHGVVLVADGDHGTTFVSREGGKPAQRPVLQVCYSLPDNHCADSPCRNGGTCENGWSGYTCHCAPGFTGTDCEVDIDDCAGAPCQNGGTCSDETAGYSCACAAGFTGSNCETNIDECATRPCQNDGVCEDGVADRTCHCDAGWEGADCESLVDNCAAEPCLNGGTCTNGANAYTCACPAGFTGSNCEIDIDDCAGGDRCRNGGVCVDGVDTFTCACPPDWGGATCELNLSSCSQNPCLNGATCTNLPGSYTCGCATGFAGTNCEINIDECASLVCENGGYCSDGIGSASCACFSGYTGDHCEIAPPPLPAITNVRFETIHYTYVIVAWDRSTASNVVGYSVVGSAWQWHQPIECDATTCRKQFYRLTTGSTFTVWVAARDQFGNEGPPSAPISAVVGNPAQMVPPTITRTSGDDNMIEVGYSTANVVGAARYHVFYRPTAGGAEQSLTTGSSSGARIVGLLANTSYTIEMQSEGVLGTLSPRSAPVIAMPSPKPVVPPMPSTCFNRARTKIRVTMTPGQEWQVPYHLPFPPDLTGFGIEVRVPYLVLQTYSGIGYWITHWEVRNHTVPATCTSEWSCSAIVDWPQVDRRDYGEGPSVTVAGFDAAGNQPGWFGLGMSNADPVCSGPDF